MTPKGKKKAKPKVKARKAKQDLQYESIPVTETTQEDDTPIVADVYDEPPVEEKPMVVSIGSFEGGFVNPCLANSVSAFWRKTPETELLSVVIHDALYLTQTFVGDIAIRNSFMQTKGGAALL